MGALFEPFLYIIGLILNLYFKIVIVEVVLHWLIHFKVLDVTNKYAKKTMEILENITHPVYEKISKRLPPVAGIDFSPFILLLVLLFLERLVYRLSDIIL